MEILFCCFYSATIGVLTLKMLGFDFTSCLLFYNFFLALQPPFGVVFYSPLAGFSLLVYEVS